MTGGRLLRKSGADNFQGTTPELALQTLSALGGLPGLAEAPRMPATQLHSLLRGHDPSESINVTGRALGTSSLRAAGDLRLNHQEALAGAEPPRVDDYDHASTQLNCASILGGQVRSSLAPGQTTNPNRSPNPTLQRDFMMTTQIVGSSSMIRSTDKTNSVAHSGRKNLAGRSETNQTQILQQNLPHNPLLGLHAPAGAQQSFDVLNQRQKSVEAAAGKIDKFS